MSDTEAPPITENPPEPVPPPKKKKKNLRVGKTAEEKAYADTKDMLLAAAANAASLLSQKNEVHFQRDSERNRKKELKEKLKVEKRQNRLDRKKEKLNKLQEESAKSLKEKKKSMKENKK